MTGAVVVLACGGVAGCSHGSSPQVATLRSSSPTAGSSAAENFDQDLVNYSKCMRDKGIADYPDPTQRAGHSGLSLVYDGNQSTSVYKAADDQCKHLIAGLIAMKEAGAAAQVSAPVLQALTAYTRCMRDRQVPLLDPDRVDGHVSLGTVAGADNTIGRRDPRFAAADTACRSLLPPGTPDDGTGPP
jgi:hypothetical protein